MCRNFFLNKYHFYDFKLKKIFFKKTLIFYVFKLLKKKFFEKNQIFYDSNKKFKKLAILKKIFFYLN
ncbi:MAG: hypothetical protein B6I24_01645 [Bacteroidetes bacterium 4572_128]|nr:MAG: hypothetical protein B6I24_01645 [Bacteroidetes bacterium 4572_128]